MNFSAIFDVLAELQELASLAEPDRKIALDRYRILRAASNFTINETDPESLAALKQGAAKHN